MLAVFTKFLFEKTRYDLLHNYNLISQKKGEKKKKKRRQSKILPHNIFKQVALLLFAQKWAFH